MTLEIPSIEKLIETNRYLNRRLYVTVSRLKKDKHFLVDSEENEVEAGLVFPPRVIAVTGDRNPFYEWGEEFHDREFCISTGKPSYYEGYLTWREAELVLGKDSFFERNYEDVRAMIEAGTGGPGLANAYVLGDRYGLMHNQPRHTIIGVQFYKINPQRHKELGIESDKRALDRIVSDIQKEREMKSAPSSF